MAPPDDSIDRQAIFARRAKLVASALSGLTITSSARAQPADAPPAAATRDECAAEPARKDQASAMFATARDAAERGDIPHAVQLLTRAYELYPHEKVALALMRLLLQQGRNQEAADVGIKQARCGGDLEEIRSKMVEIEAQSARISIVVTGEDVASGTVSVDDIAVPWERLLAGILVAPGRHLVVYRRLSGRSVEHAVEVVAGDRSEVTLVAPEEGTPMPCLSPCLSPPPPDDVPFVRLDAGVIGPFVAAVDDDPAAAIFGGGARVAASVELIRNVWFEGDLFTVFMGDDTARTVWVGTSALLRHYFDNEFGVGGGFAAGYVFDLGPEEEAGFILSSPFFGPVIAPINLRYEHVTISLTAPILFSNTNERGVRALRLSVVAPMVSFNFGGSAAEKPDREYGMGSASHPWVTR